MPYPVGLRALTAVLVGIAGCQVCWPARDVDLGHHYQLVLDPELDETTRAAARAAAEDWESRALMTIDVRVGPPGHCLAHCIRVSLATPDHFGPSDVGLAFADRSCDCGTILLNIEYIAREPGRVQQLVAHELGHMFGLSHQDGAVLMQHRLPDGSERVTCADVAQFFALRGESAPACP